MESILLQLNSLPPEILKIACLVTCLVSLLGLLRFFGASGLYVYMSLAVVVANIQVMKSVQLSFLSHPIALGTTLFSTTYLCSDILTEYYGPSAARKGVWLSLIANAIATLWLFLTIGMRPELPSAYQSMTLHHHAMKVLFIQSPSIMISGTIAYFCSQFYDIWIFNSLKRLMHGRFLWLRNGCAIAVSSFIDTFLFSILAWIVLNPHPLPLQHVWKTYILGTYWIRLLLACINMPVISLARRQGLF
jgi:queuosine precursor transporter